jgi:hypothetical protein
MMSAPQPSQPLRSNGRVAILGGPPAAAYPTLGGGTGAANAAHAAGPHYATEAVRGIQGPQTLSDVFFGQQNIDALQHGIRYLVYEKSCGKYVIGLQSEDELKIVMRSVYLTHARNLSTLILEQVRQLNAKVLEFVVPRVLGEAAIYVEYKRRVSTLPEPMARSESTNRAGSRTLERTDF